MLTSKVLTGPASPFLSSVAIVALGFSNIAAAARSGVRLPADDFRYAGDDCEYRPGVFVHADCVGCFLLAFAFP